MSHVDWIALLAAAGSVITWLANFLSGRAQVAQAAGHAAVAKTHAEDAKTASLIAKTHAEAGES
jgi:hypothetical protein